MQLWYFSLIWGMSWQSGPIISVVSYQANCSENVSLMKNIISYIFAWYLDFFLGVILIYANEAKCRVTMCNWWDRVIYLFDHAIMCSFYVTDIVSVKIWNKKISTVGLLSTPLLVHIEMIYTVIYWECKHSYIIYVSLSLGITMFVVSIHPGCTNKKTYSHFLLITVTWPTLI